MKEHVLEILNTYLTDNPNDVARVKDIIDSLIDGHDVWDRKTMTGHLTGTALVCDLSTNMFLMLEHRALKRWFAPGGHIDAGELPFNAALREMKEESGITQDPKSAILVDIDVHEIPARADKGEGVHNHFDFRYLMLYDTKPDIAIDTNEVQDFQWVDFDRLKQEYPEIHEKLTGVDIRSLL